MYWALHPPQLKLINQTQQKKLFTIGNAGHCNSTNAKMKGNEGIQWKQKKIGMNENCRCSL